MVKIKRAYLIKKPVLIGKRQEARSLNGTLMEKPPKESFGHTSGIVMID